MTNPPRSSRGIVGSVLIAIGFVVLGGFVVVAGWRLANGLSDFARTDTEYWSGVCVNVGTTLLLAIVLIWFERRIVRNVEAQNESLKQDVDAKNESLKFDVSESNSVVRAEVAQLREATTQIQGQLAGLNSRFSDLVTARGESQRAAFDALDTRATFEVVRNAMEAATKAGALADGHRADAGWVVVPGNENLDAIRIRFEWAPAHVEVDYRFTEGELLRLSHDVENGAAVEWGATEDVENVLARLVDEMLRRGEGHPDAINPAVLFENLHSALAHAVAARRGEIPWRLRDKTLEYITPDWVITQAGIQAKNFGLVIPAEYYPHNTRDGLTFDRTTDAPPGVDKVLYDCARRRGSVRFEDYDEWEDPVY